MLESLYPLSQAWSRPIAGAGSPGLESHQPSVRWHWLHKDLGVWERCLCPAAGCEISRGEEELEGTLVFKRSMPGVLPPFTQLFRGVEHEHL